MPNGFNGSNEVWEQMEAPFREIDKELSVFARTYRMKISKNYHNWPERSLRWSSNGIDRLIQIYLQDEKNLTYCVWICGSQDRKQGRFWKNAFLKKNVSWAEVCDGISESLATAYTNVESWTHLDLEPAPQLGGHWQ